MTRGGQSLAVFGTDLLGDSQKARYHFRIVATAAGRAIGGLQDAAYESWLTCLREKLQPLDPRCFRHQVLLRRDRHGHDRSSGHPARVSEHPHVA